jgi:hypothetical protein
LPSTSQQLLQWTTNTIQPQPSTYVSGTASAIRDSSTRKWKRGNGAGVGRDESDTVVGARKLFKVTFVILVKI